MTAVDLLAERPSDRALHALARVQAECAGSWAGKEHTCLGEELDECPHDDHTVHPDGSATCHQCGQHRTRDQRQAAAEGEEL
jgi:hypothetical protein